MQTTILGRTGMRVTRTGFGVLPLQCVDMDAAVNILRAAYDAGIAFYDTARGYTDSEEKIGRAFSGMRGKIVLATKSGANNRKDLLDHLHTSLKMLRTDYIDLLQLHNPGTLPAPDDPESSYAGLLEARQKGMVRYIGITSHSRERAIAAVQSGLYDTLQYPLCHISADEDLALIGLCAKANVGVIAMKPLSGGLITNARAAFAFLRQYENVVPIWGIQRRSELEKILALDKAPPALDGEIRAAIETDRKELSDDFCRACGYCLPCPQEIPIPMAARMSLLLRRMPYQQFLSDEWYEKMHKIENCTECGQCRERCPYGLNPPVILRKMLAQYEEFYQQQAG